MTGKKTLKEFVENWRRTSVVLLFIVLVAIFLRTFNLNELPIFGDEAIYVRWAQIMRNEPTLRFIPLTDGKQPLFMWVVILFQKVISDPLIAGRLVSVATGITTLVGVFVLSYISFGNRKVSLFAALIYAVSPFVVFFDRMALVDSMLSMFGVWSLIFSILTARHLRLDFAILTGFTLGGALITKSPGIFFVLMIPSSILFLRKDKKKDEVLLQLIKLGGLWIVSFMIALGIYNIQRLGPNFHMLSSRTQDYVYPISHLLSSPLDPLKPFAHRIFQYYFIMGPSVLVVMFALGSIFSFKLKKKEVLILLIWLLVPIFAVSEFSKTMTTRYILFTAPYLIILASSVLLIQKQLYKKVLVFGIVVFILQSFQFDSLLLTNIEAAKLPRSERSGYLEEWTAGTGIREVSEYIREQYLVRDLPDKRGVVVGTEGYFGPLPNGLEAYLASTPEITVIGVGLEFDEVPSSLVESRDAGNKTYLVLNSSRLHANPDDIGLKLLAAYPKAFRPEFVKEYSELGSRDTLYLFEVE